MLCNVVLHVAPGFQISKTCCRCLCTVVLSGLAPPVLSAAGLSPNTEPNNFAFFEEGEATSTLLKGLPLCTILAQNGSFLELYNVNTGFVAGWHGQFDNRPGMSSLSATNVGWNTTVNPVLDTSYNGLYRCRTDTSTSLAVYQLNVRGKFTVQYFLWKQILRAFA